MFHHCAISLLE